MFFLLTLDSSSKKELIENYLLNKTSILELKVNFDRIVPSEFKIFVDEILTLNSKDFLHLTDKTSIKDNAF